MPVWVFKTVSCRNELQVNESSLCAAFSFKVAKTTKKLSIIIRSLEDKWKIKRAYLVFYNNNHSSLFEPVLLMCCSLCSSGISMWHCTKQTDGADQRFSTFLLRTEETWKKLEPECRWWRASCVGFMCICIYYTTRVRHNSVAKGMLLHILNCPSLNMLCEKIYHKEGQNMQQVPFNSVLYLSYIVNLCSFVLQTGAAYKNMRFLKQVLF